MIWHIPFLVFLRQVLCQKDLPAFGLFTSPCYLPAESSQTHPSARRNVDVQQKLRTVVISNVGGGESPDYSLFINLWNEIYDIIHQELRFCASHFIFWFIQKLGSGKQASFRNSDEQVLCKFEYFPPENKSAFHVIVVPLTLSLRV